MSIQRKMFFDDAMPAIFSTFERHSRLSIKSPSCVSFMDMDALTFSFSRAERSLIFLILIILRNCLIHHMLAKIIDDDAKAFPVLFFRTRNCFNQHLACYPVTGKPDKEAHNPIKYVTLWYLRAAITIRPPQGTCWQAIPGFPLPSFAFLSILPPFLLQPAGLSFQP